MCAHATDGETKAGHRGLSAEGPVAFCAGLGQAVVTAERPRWGLHNTALKVSLVASRRGLAAAKGGQVGPSGTRSARQHWFHLSPFWTGWNDPPVTAAGP